MADENPKPPRRRPGTGGRIPASTVRTETTATRRVQERLGAPIHEYRGPGPARTSIFAVDARPWAEAPLLPTAAESEHVWMDDEDSVDGRGHLGASDTSRNADAVEPRLHGGIIVARLSSRERQGGETHAQQILDGWELARRHRIHVSHVITCLDYKSELEFSERYDFDFIGERLALGGCDAVLFREPERVARRIKVAYEFYEMLEDAGADLYLTSTGSSVDWTNYAEALQLSINQAFGQAERNKTVRSMSRAKRRRWLDEGRGWPGALPFGFRRNPTSKFPEIDPEQWPWVKFIHLKYRDACKLQEESGRKSGVAVLQEWMADKGVDISSDQIRRILHDTRYCDGSYTVRDHDDLVQCAPIEIPEGERIPPQVMQANVELLACQKGPHSKTPVGTFCLNGIKVRHATCAGKRHPKSGQEYLLKGRQLGGAQPSYGHVPGNPCGGRYTIPQDVLEPAVMGALREMAADPELQEAWASATRTPSRPEPRILNEGDAAGLRERIANLKAEHTRLSRELLDKVERGGRVGAAERTVLDSLVGQVDKLEGLLDLAERHESRRVHRSEPRPGRTEQDLQRALEEVLTDEVPADERMRIRRMAVVECCLSEILVRDVEGEVVAGDEQDAIEFELVGPLAPEGAAAAGAILPVSPLKAAGHILTAYADERDSDCSEDAAKAHLERSTADWMEDLSQGAAELTKRGKSGTRDGANNLRSAKYRPPNTSRLIRRYHERDKVDEKARTRERNRYENRWPRYLASFSRPGSTDVPVWRSTPISLRLPYRGAERPSWEEVRAALRVAASLLPRGRLLNTHSYWDVRRGRENELPSCYSLLRCVPPDSEAPIDASRQVPEDRLGIRTGKGERFHDLCRLALPDRPEAWSRRRWRLVDVERAFGEASVAVEGPLSQRNYERFRAGREDLPPASSASRVVNREGLSWTEAVERFSKSKLPDARSADVSGA